MKNTGGTRSHAPKYIGIFVLLLILLCALPLVASAGHICEDFESQAYPDDHISDHLCDICGVKMTECGVDEKKIDTTTGQDHLCDICYKYLSNLCADNDGDDHLCDICYRYLSNLCVDNDETPHRCDVCDEPMKNGKDESRAEFKGR